MGIASPFAGKEKTAGAVMAECFGLELPEHFGDPIQEYQAVRRGVGLVDLSFRGTIEVTGSERLQWLNGQITNEVKGLKPGEGKLAAVLNVKGHILSDLAVYGLENAIWIDLNRNRAPAAQQRFNRYIISEDVTVEVVSDRYAHLMVAGPQAPRFMREAAQAAPIDVPTWHHTEIRLGGVPARLITSRWLAMPGYDVVIPADASEKAWDALMNAGRNHGLRPVGMEALHWLRLEAGWRWYGVDFDDSNLLMESLTQEHVSFTKGCYIGQEVVIRVEHQGHVNRKLVGLLITGETVPPPGATILSGDRKVGSVTSAIHSPALGRVIALGYVRRECWDPGTKLCIALGDESFEAEVASLPFV